MKRFYTFFLVLLAFSGWIYVADAQDASTWMPDANLRTAVRSALDLNAGDTLTQADMEDLTSLTAKDSEISSITGLEHATNLTSLDLRDNAISSLNPLSGLTQLETLRLKNNDIVDITALSGLTSLTLLNLRDNDIVDITALSNLTNLEHLRVDDNSITDVQPLTGLSNLEKLWIAGNSLTNAHLLSSLTNLTTIDITIPDPPDTIAPDVSISGPSGTQNGAFNVTITFTEVVSDFVQTELALGGTATASITAWNTTNNTVFTAEITPTTSGTVTLDIAADVATDAASNGNTAATTQTVTVTPQVVATPVAPVVTQQQVLQSDTTAPDVSISVPSGTQTGALDVTITFTEVVSGFAETDLSLGGTVTASITVWNTTDNTVFTAEITPTTSGTVTLDIAADVATDAASNGNTAATQRSVTVDPALSTWMPDANLRSAVRSELDISDAYTLTQADMAELRALNLEFMQITVLTGLEHAVNLTELILYGNEIGNITPLAGLTALTELDLGLNQISDITPLTNLTALTVLTLYHNQISDITPLTNLTALTVLKLYHNQISDVTPLVGLTALTTLLLSSNPIADFAPLRRLKESISGYLYTDITITLYPSWDVNEDGSVDNTDLALVTAALGQSGEDIVNPRTDINGDGVVDNDDLTFVTAHLDADNGAPSSSELLTLLDPATLEELDPATLDAQLEILRVKSDGSLKYLRAIALLESILAAMRPEMTQLLPNYPNPFNPETWIPYHLAKSSDVEITIYDARGTIVRQLDLGHQREGYYTNRSRAAYWDGRNDLGERVASGIYFYQLQADNVSLLRKMLILK